MANRILFFFAIYLFHTSMVMADENLVSLANIESASQLWINPGMTSYHFQKDRNFNDANWGFGIEYQFSTVTSLTAGRFYNSDRAYSDYIGIYLQPILLGPIKAGIVAGGFNGYPQANHGDWFAAALPTFTWEGDRVGVTLFTIPTIGDRVHGALSLQLKFNILK